jgi:hypothetical protein
MRPPSRHGYLLAFGALLLLVGGCPRPPRGGQKPAAPPPTRGSAKAPKPQSRVTPPADADYASARRRWARAFVLHEQLAPLTARSFARVEAPQGQQLLRLQRRSRVTIKVYVEARRTLVVLPSTHPAASMRVLLGSDLEQLWVHSPDKWSYELPLAALPDILDRGGGSHRRRDERLELRSSPSPAPQATLAAPRDLASAQHEARLGLPYRYRSAKRGAPRWNVRIALRLRFATPLPLGLTAPAPRAWPLAPLALPLAAPQDLTLADVLRDLPQGPGATLGWLRTVDNQSVGSRPLRLATRVEDRGWVRMPERHFSTAQPGYRRAARLPPPRRDGLQIVADSLLHGLRKATAEPQAGVEAAATLTVNNGASVAAFLHLDGVRLGWVAPGKTFRFQGMRPGYYRLVAHAPSGVRSWDARDLYLPGELTLR